jgi:hypothetical protein
VAYRLLIVGQATAWLPRKTAMKIKLQQLDINDFTVLFLTFGLLVGLALK